MHDVPHLAEPSLGELLTAVIGFIRRQFPIILAVLPLTIGLAAVYLFMTPPLYKGETKIIFDASKVQIFKQSILEDPAILAAMDSQTEISNPIFVVWHDIALSPWDYLAFFGIWLASARARYPDHEGGDLDREPVPFASCAAFGHARRWAS